MDDSIPVVLIDKEEFTDGEIDGYTYGKKFDSFVYDITGESPRQTYGMVKFINDNETSATMNLSFTEEVKDGRSQHFNINSPLKIKNKSFTYKNITITITDIKYIGTTEQPSDYNQYFNYNYEINVTKK